MSIQFRRGTSANRTDSTKGAEILKAGQPFYETDTGKLYIGTGTTLKSAVSTLPALSQSNTFTGTNTFKVPNSFGTTATSAEGVTLLPTNRSPGQEYLKLGFVDAYPAVKARNTANMRDCIFLFPTEKAAGTYTFATTSDIKIKSATLDISTQTLSITLS